MKTALILVIATLLAACSHAQPTPDAAAKKPTLDVRAPAAPAAPVAEPAAAGQAELDAALTQLRGVSVFFKFDDATLTPEAEPKLASVGTILAKNPALKIEIAGNADERGTEQYNLALGQKRADSAKRYLVQMGARPEQVGTISYGEEKPKATGHDEADWKQNRRDDIEPKK